MAQILDCNTGIAILVLTLASEKGICHFKSAKGIDFGLGSHDGQSTDI